RDREVIWCVKRDRLTVDERRHREPAAERAIVRDAGREQHVGRRERRSVGEADVAPQGERIRQAVVGRGPALGERRLQRVGRTVHAHQPIVGEQRQEVGGGARLEVPVVVGRLAPERRNQRRFSSLRRRVGSPERDGGDNRHREERPGGKLQGSGHKLAWWPIYWPILATS